MKILDETIPLKDNLLFSLRRYRFWWLLLLITSFFDFFTTAVFVQQYGSSAEANAITRLLMEMFGPGIGNFLGKVLQLIAVVAFVSLHRRLGNIFLLVAILLNCWAIVINSIT